MSGYDASTEAWLAENPDIAGITYDSPPPALYFDDSGVGSDLAPGAALENDPTLYFDDSGVGSDLTGGSTLFNYEPAFDINSLFGDTLGAAGDSIKSMWNATFGSQGFKAFAKDNEKALGLLGSGLATYYKQKSAEDTREFLAAEKEKDYTRQVAEAMRKEGLRAYGAMPDKSIAAGGKNSGLLAALRDKETA